MRGCALPLLAGLVLAGGAMAAPQPPSPAPAPGEPHKVEGVTVTGKRLAPQTPCKSRDQVCIATVVAELKLRYPEQFEAWCVQQDMEATREGFAERMWGVSGSETKTYEPPAVVKAACVPDKTKK